MVFRPTAIVGFLRFGARVVLLTIIADVSLPRPFAVVNILGDVVVAADKTRFEIEIDIARILLSGEDALTRCVLEDDAQVFEAVEEFPYGRTGTRLGTSVGVNGEIPFATAMLYGGVGAGGAGVGRCTGPVAHEDFLVEGAGEDE